jgi:hypothetical protein
MSMPSMLGYRSRSTWIIDIRGIVVVYGTSMQISRPSLKTPGILRPSRLAPVDPSDRLRGTIVPVGNNGKRPDGRILKGAD